MLRARRLFVALTKFHEQKSTLVCIVRRSFSAGDFGDINMSGKSLPKWVKPEGDGELKLYNSLTREKVRISLLFCSVIFFFQCVQWLCDLSDAIQLLLLKSTNQVCIRFFPRT